MKPFKALGLLFIVVGLIGLFLLREASPVIRLLAASLGMIWMIKLAALCWQVADGAKMKSRLGAFLFLFAWPGISVEGFTERREIPVNTGARFLEAWLSFLAGVALLLGVSMIWRGSSTAINYVALFSVLLMIHLGLMQVIADSLRLLGFSPVNLFDRPFLASSLRDFWSVRWNRAFVDMNKIFLLGPLRHRLPPALLVFSIFAVSGALHELGISYADGASWGFPLAYFLIQGVGMQLEKLRAFPRPLVWAWLLLPAPLLFTPCFTNLFLGGLGALIADQASTLSTATFFKVGLIGGGFAHLLVLCASVQVPGKLGWREEFQKLSSLNRKVFWTYGAYILSIIIFMAIASFLLSRQSYQGMTAPTVLWLVFIAVFWWARVLTDFFYMKHEDWPQGPLFT
ncbi:MAG: hypothetical protein EOP11_19975, partial [Proteobacteria bacterium]